MKKLLLLTFLFSSIFSFGQSGITIDLSAPLNGPVADSSFVSADFDTVHTDYIDGKTGANTTFLNKITMPVGLGNGIQYGAGSDTEIFEESANRLVFRTAGQNILTMNASGMFDWTGYWILRRILSTSTVPNIIPNFNDQDVGLGYDAGSLTLISQGAQSLNAGNALVESFFPFKCKATDDAGLSDPFIVNNGSDIEIFRVNSANIISFSGNDFWSTPATNSLIFGTGNHFGMIGGWNTTIGMGAGQSITTSVDNTFVGALCGNAVTIGSYNTAMGSQALENTTTGTRNTAMGYQSGEDANGDDNAFFGHRTAFFNFTGDENTFIGSDAGGSTATAASRNVCLGYHAGENCANDNVFVGYKSGENEAGSNKLYIDVTNTTTPLIYGEFDNDIVKFNADVIVDTSYYQESTANTDWVYNNSGHAIAAHKAVYRLSGFNGVATIDTASNISELKAGRFFAITLEEIPNNSYGKVITKGKIPDYNTSGLSLFGPTYLGVEGALTNVKPLVDRELVIAGGPYAIGASEVFELDIDRTFSREVVTKDYSLVTVGSGTFYKGGDYDWSTTSVTLTQASATATYGTANDPHSKHAAIVCGGVGSVTGGGQVAVVLSGDSYDDSGVITIADKDTIVPDITTTLLDDYYEGKKWVGAVTYSLVVISGTPTAYSLPINRGLSKYEDVGNLDYYLINQEVVFTAGANDAGFNIELLHHKATGWTYAAAGFIPGDGAIASWSGTYGANDDVLSGNEYFWKITGINTFIDGNAKEGVLYRITTTSPNTVQSMGLHPVVALD